MNSPTILQAIAQSLEEQSKLRALSNSDLAEIVEDELWMKTTGGTRENDILSVVIEKLRQEGGSNG
jgi:hypothetical protein